MKRLLFIPLMPFLVAAQDAPASDKKITGSLEAGYRWVSTVAGHSDTYRSVVNLGEGPKLRAFDFVVQDAGVFDRLSVSGSHWGGDPYNTTRIDAERRGTYRLIVDYRNIDYFNYLPSFANPFIQRGNLVNQRSFDMRRRYVGIDLELRPGKRVTPFFGYTRDSGFGTGITPFVANGNEYPVATGLRDKTNHFRGGVRLELSRFHVTVEQGGAYFEDDQRVHTAGDNNLGNRSSTLFGQQLLLRNLEQLYEVRGESMYSKGLVTASPFSWLDLSGSFLYSRPKSDVDYKANAAGLFYLGSTQFLNTFQNLVTASAKQPHSSGGFTAELRPWRRLRIRESWMTDRFHNASSAMLSEQMLIGTAAQLGTLFGLDRLALNYNRQQLDILLDATSKLTLRAGHRYVWGDASTRTPRISFIGPSNAGELKRHVALAGVNVRPVRRVMFNLDYEGSSADRSYFRTSLHDYQQLRARGRVQVLSSLLVSANFSWLDNENPTRGINYDFESRAGSLSMLWTPGGGKRVSLLADYTRSSLRSDINFLAPFPIAVNRSLYRDNAHSATALLDLTLPAMNQSVPKISVGGSMFVSSGSRPTKYYQPLGRFVVPVSPNVHGFAEWRYYGMSQTLFSFEGFRTHHFVTGLRLVL